MNNFLNMQNSQFSSATTIPSIPYKPVTFEKLSNIIGMTYNLSSIENINTVSLPRGGEQQIFFVNNDDKIYIRSFDNSIGIVGYKQGYVEKLQKDLNDAQNQLHEIFDSITQEQQQATSEETSSIENRISQLEEKMNHLLNKQEDLNGHSEPIKTMAAISDMA